MKKTIIIFSHYVDNTIHHYLAYTHSHARQLVKMGYNVYVFAPKSSFPIVHLFKKTQIINYEGVNIILNNRLSVSGFLKRCPININGLFYYFSLKNMVKKLIKNNNVIMFDAHNFHCEGYTAYLLKKKYPKVKTTITFHGSDLESALSLAVERKRLLNIERIVDSYVCVSDKLTNKLKSNGINKAITIYNGIHNWKLTNCTKDNVIISVGDLIESKNFDLLIDAFADFYRTRLNFKLKIIGDGYLREHLSKKIQNMGLDDVVCLCGEMSNDNVYKELEKAKCFVLVSSPEGFGIVYPEAMYCGCVTVGTKGEGIDGFIKNGINGFLVNANKEEIVSALNTIVSTNCDKLTERAKIDAKKLTWKRNCEEYLNICDK